jgi:hypothetical protein
MGGKIRITYQDLQAPKVDEQIARQAEESALRIGAGTASGEMGHISLIHKNWFNLMIAGIIGALIAWALIEPYFYDDAPDTAEHILIAYLLFGSVGGLAGLMIGSMEGILARNYSRAFKGGSMGFLIGFGGGLVSAFVAGIVLMITLYAGVLLVGREAAGDPANYFGGFMIIMIARSLAWAVAGMTVGLGPGIALKSKKLVLNGFIGGMIGGFIGGFLFDPINYAVSGGTLASGAEASRAIGFAVIGACAGFMIGVVEMLTRDAWLVMNAGPLTGKQFILYKNPTILGSSPKCEVYLFKDPTIEAFHAAINRIRDGYDIEDNNTRNGTFVNGQRIKRKRLQNGDEIQIGGVKFLYSEKEQKK